MANSNSKYDQKFRVDSFFGLDEPIEFVSSILSFGWLGTDDQCRYANMADGVYLGFVDP